MSTWAGQASLQEPGLSAGQSSAFPGSEGVPEHGGAICWCLEKGTGAESTCLQARECSCGVEAEAGLQDQDGGGGGGQQVRVFSPGPSAFPEVGTSGSSSVLCESSQ